MFSLNDDLTRSFENVKVINNHSKFSTTSGMLSPSLSREYNRQGQLDNLHINVSGISLFSSLIKNAIFYRKKSMNVGKMGAGESHRRQQGSSSGFRSDDSENPRRGGRRGGYTNHHRRPRR